VRHYRVVSDLTDELSQAPPAPVVEEALRIGPDLRAFLRRRGHGEDARDLVQDLFVLLLSRPGRFGAPAPGSLRSLLFAIAWRIGANASRRRRAAVEVATGEELRATNDLDPESQALLSERVRRAAAALESLPEGTRRALRLVADEGNTPTEAARRLGIGEEALRARLCRGRRRIAAILEEEP
jgi:RNA polymerase sigma-70 factor (ECF subfamily)